MKAIVYKWVFGHGGIKDLLKIALPIIISQASDSIMLITDRYFLSSLGKEYPSASMAGGFSAYLFNTFFYGIAGYTTTLAGQYFGAKEFSKCSRVFTSAAWILILSFPFVLVFALYFGPKYFYLVGHDSKTIALEMSYFKIIMYLSIFSLLRSALSGLFSGIGKTKIIMIANLSGLAINVPLTYGLIHGYWGLPQLGFVGAAWSTFIAMILIFTIMITYYWYAFKEKLSIQKSLCWDWDVMKKLLVYGTPSGVEFFMTFFAFNTFVVLFHSYGVDEALAMTITFNWDLLAFLPMLGLHIGVMGMVGKGLGSNDEVYAIRSTYSGLIVAYTFMLVMGLLFLFCTPTLVRFFLPNDGGDYTRVYELAKTMLRLVSIYILADATVLIFGAALKGAGDTFWCMVVSIILHWIMVISAYLSIKVYQFGPMTSWSIFLCMIITLSILFSWRFFQGRWKKLRILKE